MRMLFLLAVTAIAVFALASAADAVPAKTIRIGGVQAVLLLPDRPRASVILMPGGDGHIEAGPGGAIHHLNSNQLVRTRADYAARGLAVLVVDVGINLGRAIGFMRTIKSPVTVIATSLGTLRAAYSIARGARPDALVLTSGLLSKESGGAQNVINILGSPTRLPRTLVIHHRRDGCHVTRPAGVKPFIIWAHRRARAAWLDGGTSSGDSCGASAHHGFAGLDGQVVALAAAFR